MRAFIRIVVNSALAASVVSLASTAVLAEDGKPHVLLLSIDGFHAVDLVVCKTQGTCPNLASLAEHGFTYTNASTTKPSDSFPGLLAQFTGGTPKSTGVFYDDSYDRTLYSPSCQSGPGAEVNLAENTDKNLHSIDGGVTGSLLSLNGAIAIDPNNLPGQKIGGQCVPLWPHNFVRTNTIFGVLHQHGFRTAWSDKHPSYDLINGADPTTPHGPGAYVDDFFAPEINSDLSQANISLIQSLGLKSTAPAPTPVSGKDFTGTIAGVQWYDGIKVQAVLNEIAGHDHSGTKLLPTPAFFGMNFQSVSVGQKLAFCDPQQTQTGGYKDPAATPGDCLANAIKFIDASIGQMVDALNRRGLLERTLIIVSAKHGQSPIDVTKRKIYDDGAVIAGPIGSNFAFDIGDDGVLIWLKDNSGSKTADAVKALDGSGNTGIGEWLSGPLLASYFQDPAHDSRTPDIVGIADTGTIYTGGSKLAEHGGFNEDDWHVALVVSNPDFKKKEISAPVATTQIAPTILKIFGLDPKELNAVRLESTPILPGFDR
jgi:hypothetical protein